MSKPAIEAEKAKPQLTDEQLKVPASVFAKMKGDPVPPPKPEDKDKKPEAKPDEKKPEGASASPEQKPEGEKTPKKKVVKVAAGYPEFDPEKLATATAKAVVEATKAKPEPEPEPDMTAAEKRYLQVIGTMEEIMPDQYKGLSGRAKAYMKDASGVDDRIAAEFKDRRDEFETEEEFAAAQEQAVNTELARLKQKHRLEWDDDHFEEAKVAMRTKPLDEKVKKLERELSKIEKERETERIIPEIRAASEAAALDVANEILGKDASKFLERGTIPESKLEKLEDEFPDAAPYVVRAVNHSRATTEAVEALFAGILPEKQVEAVKQAILDIENRFMQAPEEKRIDQEGRTMARWSEWKNMSDEQRASHWFVDAKVVSAVTNNDMINWVKTMAEKDKKRAEKITGKSKANPEAKPDEIPIPPPDTRGQGTAPTGKPESPSMIATPQSDNSTTTQIPAPTGWRARFAAKA